MIAASCFKRRAQWTPADETPWIQLFFAAAADSLRGTGSFTRGAPLPLEAPHRGGVSLCGAPPEAVLMFRLSRTAAPRIQAQQRFGDRRTVPRRLRGRAQLTRLKQEPAEVMAVPVAGHLGPIRETNQRRDANGKWTLFSKLSVTCSACDRSFSSSPHLRPRAADFDADLDSTHDQGDLHEPKLQRVDRSTSALTCGFPLDLDWCSIVLVSSCSEMFFSLAGRTCVRELFSSKTLMSQNKFIARDGASRQTQWCIHRSRVRRSVEQFVVIGAIRPGLLVRHTVESNRLLPAGRRGV